MISDRFDKLFNNRLSFDEGRELLLDLYNRKESYEDIATVAKIMRKYSISLPISDELKSRAIDIVGTGGDRSGSFNISSTVSLILSSLGSVVTKHGNRSITSSSGSADMLEALGINLNLTIENQVKMLEETGFVFMFAINHHPAMKNIMPIRKSIPHRTIFNILGPLTNPAGAKKYLLGVFSIEYIDKMAKALKELDTTRAFVVSSSDGLDEISISAPTHFAFLDGDTLSNGIIDPQEFGFKLSPKEAIMGGDVEVNRKITKDILSGVLKDSKRDIVVLNGGFALFADGKARDMKEAFEMINYAIDTKKAQEHLKKIVKVSNMLN